MPGINSYFPIKLSIALLAVFTLSKFALAQTPLSPDEALLYLQKGNERFVNGKLQEKHYSEELPILAQGQHPFAIVLTCADSRVAPEAIFDQTLGKIFVIRVAGNVADPVVLGSVEYAAEHLHTPLLFILGHESCGAVKAAVSGGDVPPNIGSILKRITPAVNKVRAQVSDEARVLNEAIKENVRYQMQMALFESEVLTEFTHQNKLKIVGGIYNLHSGRIEMLSQPNAATTVAHSENPAAGASQHGDSQKISADQHNQPVLNQAKPNEKLNSTNKPKEPKSDSTKKGPQHRAMLNSSDQSSAFEDKLQLAHEYNVEVTAKTNLLMRDNNDRCATKDCRSIPAGERFRIVSPVILSIMGRSQVKVRFKRQECLVIADEQFFAFPNFKTENEMARQ